MELKDYRTRPVEVVKTRRSGFLERLWFVRYGDAVDYISRDIWMNKEEKALYKVSAKGFEDRGHLFISYQDYRKGKEYQDHRRIVETKIKNWVKVEEDFLNYIRSKKQV